VVNDADLVVDLVRRGNVQAFVQSDQKGGRVVTVASNIEGSQDPTSKEAFFIVETEREQLVALAKLIDEGKILPVVREVFPWAPRLWTNSAFDSETVVMTKAPFQAAS
jgi:NADPH:quinone reductase-like Zn-dependent oxidoreductase